MTRIAGTSVLFGILIATTACGVGGDDGGGFTGGTDPKPGLVCSASFKLNGTFTAVPAGSPGARPQDPEDPTKPLSGCWPVGTWTFTAAVDTNECPSKPAVLSSYSFRVDRMEGADMQGPDDTYTNMTAVGGLKWHLSVASNGQGCEGNFEFGSADGKEYWNMKPVLPNPPADPTKLIGNGDYDQYNVDAWPWK